MDNTGEKTCKADVPVSRQGKGEGRGKPIQLWKFRGYKELVPDPYNLGL